MNNTQTWYLMGRSGAYYFWFRNPYQMEVGIVYQSTTNSIPPDGEAGYYNLESLMKSKGVEDLIPVSGEYDL